MGANSILTCTGRTVIPVIGSIPVAAVQVGPTEEPMEQLSVVQAVSVVHLRRALHRVQESRYGGRILMVMVQVVVVLRRSLL